MTGRHDRDDAGAQLRSGQVGVPGAAPDNTATDTDTGPFQAVERTPSGWRVGDEELPDLTSAMVLADILNAELTADEQAELDAAGASAAPPPAPPASQQDAAGRNSGLIAETQPPAPPGPGLSQRAARPPGQPPRRAPGQLARRPGRPGRDGTAQRNGRSAGARADRPGPGRAGHRHTGRTAPDPAPAGVRAAPLRVPGPRPADHGNRQPGDSERDEPAAQAAR